MARRLPHLTWLRAFEASARHLSFTSAAVELNLTQAAISKQVKLLEQYLREPLFERKPRSLVLTKIGAAYLPKVRDSFERLAAGTEEVFGNRRSEVLTVRAPVGYSVNWIAPRLRSFFDAYPGIGVQRLTWEVIEPVCAPQLLSGERPIREPSDLKDHCLLHVLGYEEGWGAWLRHVGAKDVNAGQGLQFDTSLLAFEYAATGGGVALARSSMSGPELESGRLIRPFDTAFPIDEAFYLIAPSDGQEHPDAGAFRTWLVDQAYSDPTNSANRNAS